MSEQINKTFTPVSPEVESNYNRATHLGRGRDFNAELNNEFDSLVAELNEAGVLDTQPRRDRAEALINEYIGAQVEFIQWESNHAARYPSTFVTGRGNRSQRSLDRANKANTKHMDQFSRKVDSLKAKRDQICDQVKAIENEEQKAQRLKEEAAAKLSRLKREIIKYVSLLVVSLREGKLEVAKDDRRWILPKLLKLFKTLQTESNDDAITLVQDMNKQVNDVGGLLKVVGARSNFAKTIKPLLS